MPTLDLSDLLYGGDQGANPNPLPPQPSPQVSPDTSIASTLGATAATGGAGGIGGDARYPVAPPLGWNAPPLASTDRDAMIKTVAAEAGNQPPIGQAAVAHAILNRVAAGGYGQTPGSIQSVVTAPVKPGSQYHQFSVWNAPGMQDSSKTVRSLKPSDPLYASIGDIVDRVYSGAIPDPTYGATHYFAQRAMPGGRPPSGADWQAILNQNVNKIADQTFVGGAEGPGRVFPVVPPTRIAQGG